MRKLSANLCACALVLGMSALPAMAQRDRDRGADRSTTGSVGHGPMNQDRLTREVRHQLVMLPYYSVFDNLAYRVDGNNVTLLGEVTRPTLKSDAEAAVKSIEGVGDVRNEIQVLPPSPMDDQIRRAEFRSIYGFADLYRYAESAVPSIHIIVNNGRVTLVGVVDNATDKNMAGVRANTVPGVFGVTNNLQVQGH